MAESLAYTVRPARADESGFIAANWIRSYVESKWADSLAPEAYQAYHPRLVSAAIARCVAVVAEHTEHSVLLAMAIGESTPMGPVIHYAYTKGGFRQQGLARACTDELLRKLDAPAPGKAVLYSAITGVARAAVNRRRMRFFPYALLSPQLLEDSTAWTPGRRTA